MSTRTKAQEKAPDDRVAEMRRLVAEAEQLLGESERASPAEVSALGERFEAARTRVAHLYATTRARVIDGARSTDAAIRGHPYPSLAIALGAGVLLGVLVTRRTDD